MEKRRQVVEKREVVEILLEIEENRLAWQKIAANQGGEEMLWFLEKSPLFWWQYLRGTGGRALSEEPALHLSALRTLELQLFRHLADADADADADGGADLRALELELAPHRRPPVWQQRWLRSSLLFTVSLAAGAAAYRRRRVLWALALGAAGAGNGLARHLWRQACETWETIRFEKSLFAFMSDEERELEARTLGAMVDAFAGSTGAGFAEVMEAYERAVRHPLRSSVMGPLPRLMLIQVQKMRVDFANILVALEKLMRSNELNFRALGVLPPLLLLLFAALLATRVRGRVRQGAELKALQSRFFRLAVAAQRRPDEGRGERLGEALFHLAALRRQAPQDAAGGEWEEWLEGVEECLWTQGTGAHTAGIMSAAARYFAFLRLPG